MSIELGSRVFCSAAYGEYNSNLAANSVDWDQARGTDLLVVQDLPLPAVEKSLVKLLF